MDSSKVTNVINLFIPYKPHVVNTVIVSGFTDKETETTHLKNQIAGKMARDSNGVLNSSPRSFCFSAFSRAVAGMTNLTGAQSTPREHTHVLLAARLFMIVHENWQMSHQGYFKNIIYFKELVY